MKSLKEWPLGQPALVTAIEGELSLGRRLGEQGILVGATVEVLGVAPFCGPLLIRIKGAVIAMRQGEAQWVMVQESNP